MQVLICLCLVCILGMEQTLPGTALDSSTVLLVSSLFHMVVTAFSRSDPYSSEAESLS